MLTRQKTFFSFERKDKMTIKGTIKKVIARKHNLIYCSLFDLEIRPDALPDEDMRNMVALHEQIDNNFNLFVAIPDRLQAEDMDIVELTYAQVEAHYGDFFVVDFKDVGLFRSPISHEEFVHRFWNVIKETALGCN